MDTVFFLQLAIVSILSIETLFRTSLHIICSLSCIWSKYFDQHTVYSDFFATGASSLNTVYTIRVHPVMPTHKLCLGVRYSHGSDVCRQWNPRLF